MMSCESEKWKQQNLINQVLDRDVCLFADVTCISNDADRKCIVHNKSCVSCLNNIPSSHQCIIPDVAITKSQKNIFCLTKPS